MLVIDSDVHPMLADSGESLLPFLSPTWRERFSRRDLAFASPLLPFRYNHPNGIGGLRPNNCPPNGGLPGSDPEHLLAELGAAHDPVAMMLLPVQAAGVSGYANPAEAAAVVSAFNDYFIERWLRVDDRFRLGIVVAPQNPVTAAAEIRRLAGTPGVAAVWLPVLDILMGNHYYHPIYDAAQEAGLPIVLHPTGMESNYQGAPTFAGGTPTTYAERFVDLYQIAQGNLSSLIFEGTLESFPELKVIFTELGWTWLPAMLWRMDATWAATRIEVPWVRKPPSEYVRERVRFTTQPVEEPAKRRKYLSEIAEMMHAGEILMFSSDYPHWDSDDMTAVLQVFPTEIRQHILFDTAAEAFGIAAPVAA